MKRYLNFRFVFVFCMVLFLTLSYPLAVFANVSDLMIRTDSNALMTLELNDDDYGISTFSSIGNVVNTVNYSDVSVILIDRSNGFSVVGSTKVNSDGSFSYIVPNGKTVTAMRVTLRGGSLPPRGRYLNQVDFTSHFTNDIKEIWLAETVLLNNVANDGFITRLNDSYWSALHGDAYISFIYDYVSNVKELVYEFRFVDSYSSGSGFGGYLDIRFAKTSETADIVSYGSTPSSDDYQQDVSSSLSDLSSSVGEMSDEISGVTAAIQNLQGAMEPHYNNVLTQLHHITEQLHAFWDQQFNLHHVPLMAKLSDIIDAIGNMDLEVEVNLNSLKTSIDTMSQNVQNKLQSVQEGVNNKIQESTEKVEEAVEKHGNFIIDGLKDLFIPSDDYFKSYFDDLFNYFSERFGFLSFPFDLLSRFVDLIVGTSDRDCVLTLPSFEIMGEQLLYEQSFNLTQFLEENFGFLLVAIRWGINLILLMRFVDLCGDKWNEVMIR